MDTHVIVIDAKRHQEFLKQQRKDPVIRVLLEPGDRVVVCAHCRLVFREDTWREVKGRFEHGVETLMALPIDPAFARWTREGSTSAQSAPDIKTPGVESERARSTPPVQPRPMHTQPPSEPPRPPVWTTTPPREPQPPPAPQPVNKSNRRPFWTSNPSRPRPNGPQPARTPHELWSRFKNRTRLPPVRPRQPDSTTLKLKEIPFVLRDVPTTLREVNPY